MASGTTPKNIKASLYIDGKPAEASLKNIQQVARTLERELQQLTIGTEAWNRKMAEVQAHRRYLREVQDEVRGVGGAFAQMREELGKFGSLAAGYLGFQFITSQFQGIIAGNAKLSDSLADMRRAIGLSEAGVLDLDRSLGKLDTRTSKADLRGIAVIAGKLGVARGQILSFVEATDKLTVALGDELGNSDQITTQLGKILNVFDGKVTGDNITRLGNAMVGLANAGVASAGFVTDFTQRLAPMADIANLGLGATMALGAGIEELGGRSESASTAVTKLLNDIASDLPAAAKIANVPLKEFTKLFADEPQAALLKYSAGLVANKDAFSDVAASLKDAGEEGARVISTIAMLGNNTQFFTDKVAFANNLLTDSTLINEAFALKNQTLGAEVDKVGKEFNKLGTNTTLVNMLTRLVFLTSDTIKWFGRNSAAIATLMKLVTIAAVAWGTYRIYLMLANSSLGSLIINLVKGETVMALSRTATIALAGVQALLAGNMTKAAQAMRLLNVTMAANPVGAVLAAIVAITTAIVLFSGSVTNAAKIQQNFNDIQNETLKATTEEKNKINSLLSVLRDEHSTRAQKFATIKQLRDIMPAYLKDYSDEEILAGKATSAIMAYVAAVEQRAKAEATGKKLASIDGDIADIDTRLKNGYNASATFGEVVKSNLLSGIYMGGNSWAAELKEKKAALLAQQKELRDSLFKETQKTLGENTGGVNADPNVKSLDSLKKKLEELTIARNQAALGSKEFLKLTAEMKAIQAEIDKYDPSKNKSANNKAQTEKDKAKSAFDKIKEETKKLNAFTQAEQKSANEKEVSQTEDKYNALIAKEVAFRNMKGATPEQKKASLANEQDIANQRKVAVDELRVRQENEMLVKINNLRTKFADLHESELQKQANDINKFYDDLERENLGNEKAISALKTSRQKEINAAELREKERLEKEKSELEAKYGTLGGSKAQNRLAEINRQYDEEIIALKAKFSRQLQATKAFQDALALIENNRQAAIRAETKSTEQDKRDFQIAMAQEVSNAAFTIVSNGEQAKLDRTLKMLDTQRTAELDNKDLTEEQKNQINAKYDAQIKEEKIKAFKAEQALSITQALVNGALAVTKVMAQTGILSPFAIPAIIAGTALQIGIIAAQKPPEYAEGGMTNSDPAGYVSSATVFNNSASGRPFVAGEKGKEWIAPNWMVTNPRYANIIGSLEIARKEKRIYAMGGFNDGNTNTTAQYSNPEYNFSKLENMITAFIQEQSRFNRLPIVNDYSVKEDYERKLQNDRAAQIS